MSADEPDALLLAQAHFTEAVNHVLLCGELFDANHGAGFDVRKRAGRCFGAAFGWRILGLTRFFHCGEASSPAS